MLPSEYLEQGWCQNVLWDGKGGVCLVGAALMGLSNGQVEVDNFQRTAARILGVEFRGAVDWNNDPARTQAEVVALARCVEMQMGLREVETLGVYKLEGAENALELVGAGD